MQYIWAWLKCTLAPFSKRNKFSGNLEELVDRAIRKGVWGPFPQKSFINVLLTALENAP